MSGDLGAEVVVRAAAETLAKYRHVNLVLVGDEGELSPLVRNIVGEDARLSIRHASEVVGMSEAPADALRKKKDSSMRVAIDLVKEGSADACVSAGNTGALMATAKFVLKMLPGIDHGIRVKRDAADFLFKQPGCEIRIIGWPLSADPDVLARIVAGHPQSQLDDLLPAHLEPRWPDWLGLAVGYGATGNNAGGLTEAVIVLAVVLLMQNVIQTVMQNKMASDQLQLHPLVAFWAQQRILAKRQQEKLLKGLSWQHPKFLR